MLPIGVEAANIVNVYFCFFDVVQHILHDLLSKVWRLKDYHGQAFVSTFAKGSDDDAKVFNGIVQLECVVQLH